ncbi:MAG: arylsulfatase A-like enzyme [Akkermansiaceae bacterium]|jgi:arylsulfatase A-like enzyme
MQFKAHLLNPIKTLVKTFLLMGLISMMSGAIVTPQTGGGAAIDPVGNSDVDSDAINSTELSAFEALSGRITQVNWNGIGGPTGNTIDGGDVDVRIDHAANAFSASVNSLQNYNTGGFGNGYRWTGTDGQQLTVSFGTQGGSFSNNRSVQAAGLVLLNFGGAYTDVTITYLDASDTVLSTQNFVGAPDSQGGAFGGADFFTGYVSNSPNIAKLTIDISRNAGDSLIGLDALTYVVPAKASEGKTTGFDPEGGYAVEFSNALYSESLGEGLGGSMAISLDNLAPSSFDGPGAESLAANSFVNGQKFTVGTFFKATELGASGQLLRLGLTNGGDDNYAGLPFVSIELTPDGGRFVVRNGGTNEPSDPVGFDLQSDEWYYLEVSFTRVGNSTDVAVNYEATIAEASSDGTIGKVIRTYQVLGQTGGHLVTGGTAGSELNSAIFGAFKGHDALPVAAAVIDNFYVSDAGLSLNSPIHEVIVPSTLRVVDMKFVGQELHIDLKGFDPFKQYLLKRSENLTDGFVTQIGGPFFPGADADTMVDPTPPGDRAFYRIEGVAAPRPNIVLILMDDFGFNDIGVQTSPRPTDFYPNSGPTPKLNISNPDASLPEPNQARLLTPKIDAMAAEGMRFTSFHSSSKCSPTRASLLTGRYDRRVDVNYVFWPDGRNGGGLNTEEITFPEVLRELGYATSLVGKWHLGYQVAAQSPFQLMPRRHGFEEFYGLPHSNGMTDLALIEDETILDPDFSTPAEQAQLTWLYTEQTLDFINRKTAEGQPFFVMLSHTMPHIPVYPSDQTFQNQDGSTWPKFEGASGVSSYYDIVMEADHSVDRILSRLETLGIDDNTLVIFTSDNGPWTRLSDPDLLDRSVGSAYPLRDSKLTTWEGGCRVPFIARWPGVIPSGTTSGETVGTCCPSCPVILP